jgi:hypothetical protein
VEATLAYFELHFNSHLRGQIQKLLEPWHQEFKRRMDVVQRELSQIPQGDGEEARLQASGASSG